MRRVRLIFIGLLLELFLLSFKFVITWSTKRLSWNPGASKYPAIAVDSSNHIHVVWYDDSPGNYEIYYKHN